MSEIPELAGPAGAAFLLAEPARLSIGFDHPKGRVIVRDGAANVTVNLSKPHKADEVKVVAWQVIQESFDLLSAKRQAALSTTMGDSESVSWVWSGSHYDVTCVVTSTATWSISGKGTVGGATPTLRQQTFLHHDSLRFYRMSQCADGLFDAYRNAYLALECLVSDVDPKRPRETELTWLNRVIGGTLAQAVPSGLDVTSTIEAIYRDGRNRLFHAKTGETFFAPHGARREEVQMLFQRLTLLLVSLLQHKLGREVVRRWATMSQSTQDAQTRIMFDFDGVRFDQQTGEVTVAPKIEIVESPRRFGQLWAKVLVVRPAQIVSMKKVTFINEGQSWLQLELDEAVGISKVGNVIFEVNSANRNLYAPRPFHPQ